MDSLIREAHLQEDLRPIHFDRLKDWYSQSVGSNNLERKTAKNLVNYLLSKTGEKTDSKVRPELKGKAKAGLEVLLFFLKNDEGVQDEVERHTIEDLSTKLKLERHLNEGSDDHKEQTISLIEFLSTNYAKFSDWRLLLRSECHELVAQCLSDRQPDLRPRLSSDINRSTPMGPYHDTPTALVCDLFVTRPEIGLFDSEAKSREKRYGTNTLPRPPPPSLLKVFWYQISDFMVLILLAAALASLPLGEYFASAVLLLVVFFNVGVGFTQEMKARKAIAALESLQVSMAQVVRDGEKKDIPSAELVPGDIVHLEEGCKVPADIRLCEAVNLQINEALLTGESLPIEKKTEPIHSRRIALGDMINVAFMSTTVERGRGIGIVTATGKATEVGKISKALSKTDTETSTILQSQLRSLGKILVILAGILCCVVVGIGIIRKAVDNELDKHAAIELIEIGVSLGVSVIPEGLVAVTTICMTLGTERIAKKNAIVRKLASVESLGSITMICSDKTGTLTEGRMKADVLWICGVQFSISGSGVVPIGDFSFKSDKNATFQKVIEIPPCLRLALQCCSLCNNSSITKNEKSESWDTSGDPTEVALVVAAEKGNLGKADWISSGYSFVNEAPFDSDRKRMSVVYWTDVGKDGVSQIDGSEKSPAIMLSKGAPESLIKRCNQMVVVNENRSKTISIDEKRFKKIENRSLEMARDGLRVLGLAFKPMTVESVELMGKVEEQEQDLIFLGLVGLIDPPRMEVKEAISACRDAGIRVCMITGDHPLTAFAIAVQLGIAQAGEESTKLLKGQDLDSFQSDDLDILADMNPFPSVFARVNPEHKTKIVEALKLKREICAMTGDGVNDAPAIKRANVGIAMGQAGTDLTKDAADVILSDDNFSTIVMAIKEGRHIYDNILKFILYLLSCNSAEIYVMLLAGIVGLPVPFTALMILWVNLVADSPPALALGVDPPSPNIMSRGPRDPRSHIFSWRTILLLFYQGLSIALWSLILYGVTLNFEAPSEIELTSPVDLQTPIFSLLIVENEYMHLKRAQTLCLVSLTFMQLVHAYLSRSPRATMFSRHFFTNRWLHGGVLLSSVCMVLGVYIPGFNKVFGQVPLPGIDWAKVAGSTIAHIIMVESFKVGLRIEARLKRSKEKQSLFWSDV